MLIEPPFYRLFKETYSLCRNPLSLGYLSAMIKKFTYWDVMAYNADFAIGVKVEEWRYGHFSGAGFYNYLNTLKDQSSPIWKEVAAVISNYQPDVVGISAKTQNFASAKILANIVKTINKKIIVIIGGVHPTLVGSKVLECLDIDMGVKGEAEQTIIELLNAIEGKKSLDAVPGIIYRKDGKNIENSNRELMPDLDSLPFPHQYAQESLKDYDKYPKEFFAYIFATRGCPYNCFFCGSRKIWGQKVRFRSPENVVKEIMSLQKMGLKYVHFDDDTFGVNRQYVNNLCQAIMHHCPEIHWSCEMHASLVDEETISLMKKAGCCRIQLGIESGNDEILKKIKKGITVEQALKACKIIKKYDITLHTFFMFGFPWDSERTMRDTLKVMKKVKSDYLIYNVFTPYPGTEAFEVCRQKGLIKDECDWSLYYHQSPINHFCPVMSDKKFRKFLSKIARKVDRINYRRPNIFQRLIILLSPNKLQKIYKLGLKESLKKAVRFLFRGRR